MVIIYQKKTKYGEGPIFVAGDSGGDFAMLTDFEDTKLALIIKRCKGGNIGEISKEAADTFGKENAKCLLQGRNENLGVFRPSQKSIFLGSSEQKLLK